MSKNSYKEGAIDGVIVTPLKIISDERGYVAHMLRSDDSGFKQFGEIYFSGVHPGVIKAWHLHTKMTLNYAVIFGKVKLVLYDSREDSSTKGHLMELFPSRNDNYQRITIPPGIWNGFKGLETTGSIVANCATHMHDVNEIKRMDPFDERIGYNWETRHG